MGCATDHPNKFRIPWTKAYTAFPRDNLISHVRIKHPQFVPSYEYDEKPPPMNLLLGMEYSRIWHRERDMFSKCQTKLQKRKIIPNNYHEWIKKRRPKKKTEKCDLNAKPQETKTQSPKIYIRKPKCKPECVCCDTCNKTGENTVATKNTAASCSQPQICDNPKHTSVWCQCMRL